MQVRCVVYVWSRKADTYIISFDIVEVIAVRKEFGNSTFATSSRTGDDKNVVVIQRVHFCHGIHRGTIRGWKRRGGRGWSGTIVKGRLRCFKSMQHFREVTNGEV